MKINPAQNPIVFGYKSILKTLWLKGELPTVKKGIYGGILKADIITLEHIKPKSKGGLTRLDNLALAIREFNELRGNKPLRFFLDKDVFTEYIEQFEQVQLSNFNGKEYVKNLIKTVIDTLEMGR